MTRKEALLAMQDSSDYTMDQMMEDRDYILKKLEFSLQEWDQIMKSPNKDFSDYKSRKHTPTIAKMVYSRVTGKRV